MRFTSKFVVEIEKDLPMSDWLQQRKRRYLHRVSGENVREQFLHNVIAAYPSKFQELSQRVKDDVLNYNAVFSGSPDLSKCHALFEDTTRGFTVTVAPRQVFVMRSENGTILPLIYRKFPGPVEDHHDSVEVALGEDLSVQFSMHGEFLSIEDLSQALLDWVLCG
jgi:hypothetical protein